MLGTLKSHNPFDLHILKIAKRLKKKLSTFLTVQNPIVLVFRISILNLPTLPLHSEIVLHTPMQA